jgi:hypothetical protein
LTLEEAEGDPIGVWPDNLPAINVLLAMGTQWRTGFAGITGLDYGALPEVWRRLKIPPAERDQVFQDLRTAEKAALEQVQLNNERANP